MNSNIATPFGNLEYLGDLLSNAYPTTLLFYNEFNQPFIVEWIDVDDEDNDIYYLYKSSIQNLGDFIKGIISHIELINLADKKKFYEFYNSIFETEFVQIEFANLDRSSLPNDTSYFPKELSTDFKLIADFFKIELISIKEKITYFDKLKNYSKDVETGLFRMHINEGTNIGHGTADTKVLGQLLINFENLYHEMAIDVIRGTERKAKINNLQNNVSISKMSSTEVVIKEAASFSIYLKSKTDSTSISSGYEFVSDEIFDKINAIISDSSDKKKLELIKSSYSSSVFKSLVDFSETILENKIVVDLDYFNSNSNQKFSQVIKPSEAQNIQNNIISSSVGTENKLSYSGQFIMINTKTGYFVFFTKEKLEISGYVSNLIREGMITFNFKNTYNVTIQQNTISELNSNKFKFKNTLESCLEI